MSRLARTAPWRFLRFLYAGRRLRRRLSAIRRTPAPPGKRTLLVIDHHFSNEVRAMQRHAPFSKDFEFLVVDSFDLFNKNLWYFPPSVWYAEEPWSSPRFEGARRRARALGGRVLDAIRRTRDVAAIITPSDSFYWLRGTIEAGNERGIPTFTFDKEGTISPAGFLTDTVKIREHFPPISHRYYVWSERQRDFWVQAGADPARIRVLGSLRSDLYAQMPPPKKTRVLLWDFDPNAYALMIPPEDRAKMPDGWAPLKREIHEIMRAAALANPKVPFTVKCHPQQTDVEATRRTFDGVANVRIVTGSRKVDELTAEHSMAIGFQTTALMETALTGRPAVYAGWGPLHEALRHHLVPLFEPGFGIHVAKGPDELRRYINDHIAGKKPPAVRRERLEMFFHRADGHVAERYHRALAEDLAPLRATVS